MTKPSGRLPCRLSRSSQYDNNTMSLHLHLLTITLLCFDHPNYSSTIPRCSKFSLFTVFLHLQNLSHSKTPLLSTSAETGCLRLLFQLPSSAIPSPPSAWSHPSAPQAGTNSGASARREAAVAPAPLALAPAFACVSCHLH